MKSFNGVRPVTRKGVLVADHFWIMSNYHPPSDSSSDSTATEQILGDPDLSPPGYRTTDPHTAAAVPAAATLTSTAPAPMPSPTTHHVHYSRNLDTNVPAAGAHPSPRSPVSRGGMTRSDTDLSQFGLRRRNTQRASTFKTISEFDQPGWHPGAEPGIDTSKPDGGHGYTPDLQAECQITIVDFSQDHIALHELDNAQMIAFLQEPQPEWVKCRWINVNGLSWDVIQALGNYKKLHRLAIEDVMNTANRTKADWYSSHAFIVLTCQKLVRMIDPDSSDDEEGDRDTISTKSRSGGLKRRVKRWWAGKRKGNYDAPTSNIAERGHSRPTPVSATNSFSQQLQATDITEVFNPKTLCTLQRYRASQNEARTDFMERHSSLASRGLAVMAEQVSMFITSDNTVIAFFEQSADDVERPILARLHSPGTILRQSCDASMVGQAIIDAIIDMAIPVAACYSDVVGDLELDVLTRPSIKHTKSLYIIISEINKMSSFVNPIGSLIQTLRDHKTSMTQDHATKELQNPTGGVIITPTTYTYLGDVYDHCILITESLHQIKESANGMIDLIFNTISAYQNESMKQLTVVTIIFLPLTFLTGYFGQNFEDFDLVKGSFMVFWYITILVSLATILLLMQTIIKNWFMRFFQRRQILSVQKKRQ